VTLYKLAWSDVVESVLRPVLGDDVPVVRGEVERGISELFQVDDRGYLVTRIEDYDSFREFVIVAAVGHGTDAVLPKLIGLAQGNGIDRIRVHSNRPGMGRLLRGYGFTELHRVYQLNGIQKFKQFEQSATDYHHHSQQ